MKKEIIKYLFLILVLTTGMLATGQTSSQLYGLRTVPQSSYQNPAFFPDETKFVMSIPLISGVSTDIYNTAFSFDELFSKNGDYDSLYLDLNPIINKNAEVNKSLLDFQHDLLMFGFQTGGTFITFGLKQRFAARAIYSDDLMKFFWQGNNITENNNLDFSNSYINEMHIFDYHFGMSIKAGQSVILGFRLHLLQGLSNISLENNKLNLKTFYDSENVYRITGNTDFRLHTSGFSFLNDSTQFSPSSYFLDFKNTGFAFDFGIDAKISEQINITASILDLGSISWRNDVNNHSSTADSINFSGITVDILNDSNIMEHYSDTLKNILQLKTDTLIYTTSLKPRIMLSCEYYSFNMRDRISFLFAGKFAENGFEPLFSFGYDRKVSDKFTYKITYTYLKYAPLTFGAGMAFDFKPFQFYVTADNIFQFVLPKRQRFFQLSFGLNIKIPGYNFRRIRSQEKIPHNYRNKNITFPDIVDF